jgi:ribosomal protein S18 acetylase RimI-like enzyme
VTRVQGQPPADIAIRDITSDDALLVASLHTASWRTAYRGILRDAYLDDDIETERAAEWTRRLRTAPIDGQFGVLAFDGLQAVGFAFVYRNADPVWGHLLDNLHVMTDRRSGGIGPQLLRALAERLGDGERLHLWVYDGNTRARAFYDRVGGRPVERQTMEPPGGGTAVQWRYVWDDVAVFRASR